MRYIICHESVHTMRVRMGGYRMSMRQADILEYYLRDKDFVRDVKVYDRTGGAIVTYESRKYREALLKALSDFSYTDERAIALVPEETGRELDRQYEEKLVSMVCVHCAKKLFLPVPLSIIWTTFSAVKFIFRGIKCLLSGKLEVPVLDAAAITASLLRGDFATASSVMFLLDTGDVLEEWTHKKSVGDLARAMSLNVDKVWMKTSGADVLMKVSDIRKGDRIVVRTSNIIPFDGVVYSGEMTVNQASMTGESAPVFKEKGGYVFAGTVVEEGECVIEVAKDAGSGKYDQIVRMIEESEKLKSDTETKAYHLADRLVPYSLLGTGLTYMLTRNITRALSFLMVDFSCALKLSMPLSVLSAIKEAGESDISVKGGKFLEAVAEARTIVFDKTGTLTHAKPKVVSIVTFDGANEKEMLRVAACLEEHYPHSVANAVIAEAKRRRITHREMHSKVRYVVAHGIASDIDGQRTVIGSYHFVFEDEKCKVGAREKKKLNELPSQYTHLYLAIEGKLKAVICIFDELRKEAPEVIRKLHKAGIDKICMMTGDNESTAASVAAELGLDEYYSEVLPEDKAAFIQNEHKAGRKVIMVGDGVNDTPALSEADVGIAISDGAAIARQIADVTVSADSLYEILTLRKISTALMDRIRSNYRFILAFNGTLIALGVAGVMQPATSALLHNTSTIITGLRSMTKLLPEDASSKPELTGSE